MPLDKRLESSKAMHDLMVAYQGADAATLRETAREALEASSAREVRERFAVLRNRADQGRS